MSEQSTDPPQQIIPNYAILPFALLKSQLYWFYSALCWIFKDPKTSRKPEQRPTIHLSRDRSKSEPIPSDQDIVSVTKRRSSAPGVRERPTEKDERIGTTCPPVWWQKTRVKLGHAPVHGDVKSITAHKHLERRSKRKMLAKLLHRKHVSPPV